MKNAAATLVDLLDQWAINPNTTPEAARTFEGDDPWSFWDRQNKAVACMLEIEAALDQLQLQGAEVRHFRECLPDWYRPIYGLQPTWGSSVSQARYLLDRKDRTLLVALGQLLESSDILYAPLAPAQRNSLDVLITEALELVNEADYLTGANRAYIQTLIQAAHRILTDPDSAVTDELRRVMFTLGGVLLATSEMPSVPAEKRSAWKNLAVNVSAGLVTEGATQAIGAGVKFAKLLLDPGSS